MTDQELVSAISEIIADSIHTPAEKVDMISTLVATQMNVMGPPDDFTPSKEKEIHGNA